jgi:hypothetical protein
LRGGAFDHPHSATEIRFALAADDQHLRHGDAEV